MRKIITILFFCVFVFSNQVDAKKFPPNKSFSFVFMTDIHLQPEKNATEGFLKAIEKVNELNPDFVITGGDLIMDALGQTYSRSDSLYKLYEEMSAHFKMPVYNTIGNHDIFGLYEKSGVDSTHQEYGKKMFENRLAERFSSFEHKGWHFISLDGIGYTNDRQYYGYIDSLQVRWLEKELAAIGKEKPVVISTHIPLLSIRGSSLITNAPKIRKILEDYNVKSVLQGHLHILEDIFYNNIHYITGGAVCANWWKGTKPGMEEGFIHVTVNKGDFKWEYIDYGWEVE